MEPEKKSEFIPLFAFRCDENPNNREKYGNVGYYNGRKVFRKECRGQSCRWRYENGQRVRIVTFHFWDIETGERVATERRPYIHRGN